MMKIIGLFLIAFLVLPIGGIWADDNLPLQARKALKKATTYLQSISTHGGYAGIYSLDLRKRYGEAFYEPVKPTEIWVQPPGTPSIGQCFLRAYRITGDVLFLQAARDTARALMWSQRKAGGWDHILDIEHFKIDSEKPKRKNGKCTFDDNITQNALDFLINMDNIDEKWLSEAIQLGLNFMLEAQFENGAWPQYYPLIGGYHDYYTFNDKAINDCIRVMLKAHRIYGKEKYLQSAKLGGDFIILSQLHCPQSGWAQQYSHDMKPAWARPYEPPGVCSAVTAANINTLVELYLYTNNVKYLEPIPAAIDWLKRSKISGNMWARLYELDTNRPIYGDRDGKVHYNYEEISEERKHGYTWQNGFGIAEVLAYYHEIKKVGIDRYLVESPTSFTTIQLSVKAECLAPKVKETISIMDGKGRWVNDNMIRAKDFVNNFNLLCDYLELTQP